MRVKVVTVLPKDEAIKLCRERTVEDYNTIPNIAKPTLEVLKYAMRDKVEYSKVPVLGVCRIYGDAVNIKDNWQDITDFLPAKGGSIFFEVDVPEEECLFLRHKDLIKFNILSKSKLIKEQRVKLIQELLSKCSREELTEEAVLVLMPGVKAENCRCFSLLNQNWEREESIEGLTLENINSLNAF